MQQDIDLFIICEEGQDYKYIIERWSLKVRYFKTPKSLLGKMKHSIKHINFFHEIILNHIAASKLWMIYCLIISKKTTTNRSFNILNKLRSIKYIPPISNMHEIWQNLCLVDKHFKLNRQYIYPKPKPNLNKLADEYIKKPYIILQPVSANNQNNYKNWPIQNWALFIDSLLRYLPSYHIVLIGDSNETEAGKFLLDNICNPNLQSTIGRTGLTEVFHLIANAHGYIGPDSGWRHACVAYEVPTFCIWGATSPIQYGYEYLFHSNKHKDICTKLPCHPCYAWPTRNSSRVTNARNCPDYMCIKELSPRKVFDEFILFWNKL